MSDKDQQQSTAVDGGVASPTEETDGKFDLNEIIAFAVAAEAEANMAKICFEPPTFVSETKSYATYKDDLYRWSRITSVPAKQQAEVVVYGLEGHPSGIKEKITTKIGKDIEDAPDGIKKLVEYLDTIYKKDEMADAWTKYKNFQKVSRADNININDFIAEFEKEYLLAKTAGCEFSDTLWAFRLLEATNLIVRWTKNFFKLESIHYEDAKDKKNLVDQFKTSLKKFQGRQTVSGEEKVRYDPALVSQVTQVLISEGWKKPANIKTRRRSNTDPGLPPSESQKSKYKGKKNPLSRKDGSQLKCFKCQSEYHFIDSCPKLTDKEKEKGDSAFAMCVTSSNISGSDEYVMIAKTKEELCLLVEEAESRV